MFKKLKAILSHPHNSDREEEPQGGSQLVLFEPNLSTDLTLEWEGSMDIPIEPTAPPESPEYTIINIEVTSRLMIQSTSYISMKKMCDHIDSFVEHYKGDLYLFPVAKLFLCVAVCGLKFRKYSSELTHPYVYETEFNTVIQFVGKVGLRDWINSHPLTTRVSWDSCGVNYRTRWNFSLAFKRSLVPGVLLNSTCLVNLRNVLDSTNLSYEIDHASQLIKLI